MDKSLNDMRSALITSIDNQMVALRAQIKSLEAIGGQATSQIASNPKQSKYLLSVERQQKVKESLYLYLLQNVKKMNFHRHLQHIIPESLPNRVEV